MNPKNTDCACQDMVGSDALVREESVPASCEAPSNQVVDAGSMIPEAQDVDSGPTLKPNYFGIEGQDVECEHSPEAIMNERFYDNDEQSAGASAGASSNFLVHPLILCPQML
ncbi:hypothetical protein V6N13_093301 [Hibiscus sabdariffa]|uniref:Uncharacterized protein n=2 Tax=Hibiscus sabdariffa TaxID=183260 RepID=A0ABR2C924_9ROSI